jgi:hypothetical protein
MIYLIAAYLLGMATVIVTQKANRAYQAHMTEFRHMKEALHRFETQAAASESE